MSDRELIARLRATLESGKRLWTKKSWIAPAVAVAAAIAAALRSDDTLDRAQALSAYRELLARYADEDHMYGDHRTGAWAFDVLTALGSDALDRIVALLDDDDARSVALEVFGIEIKPDEAPGFSERGPRPDRVILAGREAPTVATLIADARERAHPQLIAALYAPDPRIRGQAIGAFGALDDEAAVLDEILAATRDPVPRVRSIAIDALQRVERAQDAVAGRIDDDDVDVRRAAVRYFNDRRPPASAIPAVMARLDDADDVVMHAVSVLGNAAVLEARDALASALGRARDDALRLNIGLALAAIADASTVPALRAAVRGPGNAALIAALTLGRLRATEATLDVVELLADDRRRDGPHTVFAALGMLGDLRAAPALRAFVERSVASHPYRDGALRTDPTEYERRNAIEALGILGDVAARPLARDGLALGDVYMRRAAALALGSIGTREDLPQLTACFDGPEQPVLPERARFATVMIAPETLGVHLAPLLASFEREVPLTRDYGAALERLAASFPEPSDGWRRFASGVLAWIARQAPNLRCCMMYEAPERLFEREMWAALVPRWRAIADS